MTVKCNSCYTENVILIGLRSLTPLGASKRRWRTNFCPYPEPVICAPRTLNLSAERVGFVKELPGAIWKAERAGAMLGVRWRLNGASLIFPHSTHYRL